MTKPLSLAERIKADAPVLINISSIRRHFFTAPPHPHPALLPWLACCLDDSNFFQTQQN
jgi:hypothetical protein